MVTQDSVSDSVEVRDTVLYCEVMGTNVSGVSPQTEFNRPQSSVKGNRFHTNRFIRLIHKVVGVMYIYKLFPSTIKRV